MHQIGSNSKKPVIILQICYNHIQKSILSLSTIAFSFQNPPQTQPKIKN